MSGFSSEWLALREPVDARARNREVLDAFVNRLMEISSRRAPHLLDLGSGTGSSLRALAPLVNGPQHWTLCDHDPALLAIAAQASLASPALSLKTIEVNLSAGLPDELLAGADAVTTSAFLDLVSATWIDGLVDAITSRGLPFLAMLSYDGRARLKPAHPFDETVRQAMNRHQLADKGLGQALGPGAAIYAINAFIAAGYTVVAGASDWRSLPQEANFGVALVDGWAHAAEESGENRKAVANWLNDRHEALKAGQLEITVGHIDMAALPRSTG